MDSRLKRAAFRGALIGVAAAAAIASAATFNLFQPANGILKGNPSTYVTTPAGSGDVIGLWSATCNNTTYLRGDGQCAAPPGSGGGTVSSVGLTMPSGFTVGGSPVTGSSVLAVTTTLSGVLKGTGSGFTTAAASDVVGLFSGCTGTDYLGADGACHVAASVALTAPSVFAVGGTPVTGVGTLAITFATGQTANEVLASPNGSSGAVGLRALVGADIPAINVAATGNGGITGSLPFASLTITSANVIGLWTGTCSASTFLRGDGACISPGGGGTVTSVGLTAPSVFTVGGSPVTGAGTLAVTFAGGQTANSFLATPNGTTGAVGLRTIVAGDLPGSITSNTSGNAATATAAAASPTQCTSGQYATGVTTLWAANCAQVAYSQLSGTPSIPVGANPSATVQTAAINGSATTFMRSDASPAINQAISPTWTGAHIFASGIALTGASSIGPNSSLDMEFSGGQSNIYSLGSATGTIGGFRISLRGAGYANANNLLSSTQSGAVLTGVIIGDASALPAITLNGATTVTAPASGTSLTVDGTSGSFTTTQGSTGAASTFNAGWNVGISSSAWNLFTSSTDPLVMGTSGAAAFTLATNGVGRISIASGGGVTINAPTSSTSLTVNAASGQASGSFIGIGTVPLDIEELSAAPGNVLPAFVAIGNASVTGGSGINGDLILAARTSNANWIDFVTGGASGGSGSVVAHISGAGGLVMASPTGGSEGLGTVNATGLFVNGIPVVTSAISGGKNGGGVITGTPSTCTVNFNAGGVSTCNYNGVGNYTFNFTTGYFATGASCTTSAVSASAEYATSSGYSTGGSTMGAILRNSSGTPVDGSVAVTCIGN